VPLYKSNPYRVNSPTPDTGSSHYWEKSRKKRGRRTDAGPLHKSSSRDLQGGLFNLRETEGGGVTTSWGHRVLEKSIKKKFRGRETELRGSGSAASEIASRRLSFEAEVPVKGCLKGRRPKKKR